MNEIQTLSLVGTTIDIENGNVIDLAPIIPTDTDDQSLTLTGTDLTIEDGNTVDLSAVQDGVDDADADPLNEIQTLSLVGTTVEIQNGNAIDLAPIIPAAGTDDQSLILAGTDLTIEDGNTVDLSVVQDGVNDADADPSNEIQNLDGVLSQSNDANNNAIANLADPTNAQDAATKNYVDVALSTVSTTLIKDTDEDTKIDVEESVDEDLIRFDIGGTELFTLSKNSNGEGVIGIDNPNGNIFIGQNAGASNTANFLDANTFIGNQAGTSNTDGDSNTFIGDEAGSGNTTGFENTFIGADAGKSNADNRNTFIGHNAGQLHTTGGSNVFIGEGAGSTHTEGDRNIFIGQLAGVSGVVSNRLYIDNLIYGEFDNSLLRVNGSLNINNAFTLPTADGTAGQVLQTDGAGLASWSNVPASTLVSDMDDDTKIQVEESVDEDVIRLDIEGTESFVFTRNASGPPRIQINDGNVLMGGSAGAAISTGTSNTMLGTSAGENLTTGFTNTFIGRNSGKSSIGAGDNTFIGAFSGEDNLTGGNNTFIGLLSGARNVGGSFNTFLGWSSGLNHTSGNSNVFIGQSAGANNLTGSDNVFLGKQSGQNETGSNRLYIDNSNTTTPLIYGEFDNDIVKINGNLGVGTANPVERLHVTGGDFRVDGTFKTWGTFIMRPDVDLSNDYHAMIIQDNGGANKFLFGANGKMGINADYGNVTMNIRGVEGDLQYFAVERPETGDLLIVDNNDNVSVTNNLSKGGGSFKIDHPLDPENKYLYHSFVESPDMMNVYNGNVTTNNNGIATVELPDYFLSLNKDYRYQLTVIGTFAQAIIKEEVSNNKFVIQTNEPNVKVSWQVTGIRQDAYANKNRIPNSVDKAPEDRGLYLHPEAFGQPASRSIGANRGKKVEMNK